ncbi:MAG TPA: hypothetical protein VHH72_09995 [Solirubrobacterales bacterium]|jgi:hypothetical protein|nr:hypothetical protein [Solirubrobacterales bacterium]
MYYKRQIDTAETITIRRATAEDRAALERVAQRDSADVPRGELLVAVAGDELYAAISTKTREVIADPFQRTEEAVGILVIRAAQLKPGQPRRTGLLAPLRRGRRGSFAPQPAGTLRPARSGSAPGHRPL